MLQGIKRRSAATLAVLVSLLAPAANAALLTPFNTDDALGVIGSPVASLSDDFSNGVGLLNSTVFLNNDGIYTYALEFVGGTDSISEFNTGFAVAGLIADGTEVGFSFSGAAASGGTGTAADVDIFLDPNGTLDFEIAGDWFGVGDTMLFHFRSVFGPETGGRYNAINGTAGVAKGFAPVPLPGAVWLMLSAFGALVAMRRR